MDYIKEQLYQTAFENEKEYGGCAQCTMSSINEHLLPVSNDIFASATAFAGGCAATGNICGGCSGLILILGSLFGRDYEGLSTEQGNENKQKTTELAKKVVARFEQEYGSMLCREIQAKLFGRGYNMALLEEREAFLAAGGHGDFGCPTVTGKAAVWFYEILKEEGLLPEKKSGEDMGV